MDTTIAAVPDGKRGRNSSIILTDRICEKRVAKRVKFYDRKCQGLYVSIIPAGTATFNFKFTDRHHRQAAHRPCSVSTIRRPSPSRTPVAGSTD